MAVTMVVAGMVPATHLPYDHRNVERDMSTPSDATRWPELPYAAWKDTCETLRLWTQIVGKIRLANPWLNHSWHVTLYVTARGLTTSPIPDGGRAFRPISTFIDHVLGLHTSDERCRQSCSSRGGRRLLPRVMAALYELGIAVLINDKPNEIADAVRFIEDRVHPAYDRRVRAATGAWSPRRTRCSRAFGPLPRQGEPGAFLLGQFRSRRDAVLGTQRAAASGGVPHLPDDVAREAYSHEVSARASGRAATPSARRVTTPTRIRRPRDFSARRCSRRSVFHEELAEFLLPYDAVRDASDPRAVLMGFLRKHLRRGR